LPVDTPGLPAAIAVRGNVGVMEGTDYRGVPVVAALRTIPGTPWHLVAKVDSGEIFTPVRERAWVVAIVTTLLIVIAGIGVGFWWKHEATRFYRHELAGERERQAERTRLLEREREARMEAETANRMKDEFLATVSHELRTPLNPILGWAYALRTSDLDPDTVSEAYETIERNARLQSQLIEDLLDVSRIITGKLYLDVRPVDLHGIIRSAQDSVHLAASAKNIQMDLDLSPLNETVYGDTNRLQQVVWNLLSNAVKFTPEGGRIAVRLKQTDGHVEIQVSDTGLGMSPEFLPYAFDRFRQADEATSRRKGGLGLGLAIVRHIVELHGGTVSASSPGEGRGSTFVVILPLFQPEKESPAVEKREIMPSG
jgi:signal transduction histidine kinase